MTTSADPTTPGRSQAGDFDFSVYEDFATASQAVLVHLRGQLGFPLWMVTRVDGGDDWIVLQAVDDGIGIQPGGVYHFSESLCSRMVRGLGPHIAPRVADVPAYATADFARRLNVAAYVGVPLTLEDGTVFGTLCGFDTTAHPADLTLELPLVRLLARLLSTVLSNELRQTESTRRTERAQFDSEIDPLTQAGNREMWDRLLALEEARCSRYGHPACVITVDLDDLGTVNATEGFDRGDDLLIKTATAMTNSCRANDLVARIGEDDFAVLAVECDVRSGARLVRRLERAFVERGVRATLGLAGRDPSKGLEHAWHEAVRELIKRKRTREARRGA